MSLDLLGLFDSVGLGFLIGLALDCLTCLHLLKHFCLFGLLGLVRLALGLLWFGNLLL